MDRVFALESIRLVGRRAHHERALRHHHHLGTDVAFPETVLRLQRLLDFRRQRLHVLLGKVLPWRAARARSGSVASPPWAAARAASPSLPMRHRSAQRQARPRSMQGEASRQASWIPLHAGPAMLLGRGGAKSRSCRGTANLHFKVHQLRGRWEPKLRYASIIQQCILTCRFAVRRQIGSGSRRAWAAAAIIFMAVISIAIGMAGKIHRSVQETIGKPGSSRANPCWCGSYAEPIPCWTATSRSRSPTKNSNPDGARNLERSDQGGISLAQWCDASPELGTLSLYGAPPFV